MRARGRVGKRKGERGKERNRRERCSVRGGTGVGGREMWIQ